MTTPPPDWYPDTVSTWADLDTALPEPLRQRWRAARTVADLGARMGDYLTGDLPFQPGSFGPSPDPETAYLTDFLSDYCRAGFITDGSQPGVVDQRWRQRAFVCGFATADTAATLRDSLTGADLVVTSAPLTQTPTDLWPHMPVTSRGGEGVTRVGYRLNANEAMEYFGEYTSVPWKDLVALHTVQIIDPVWERDDYLWLQVHLALIGDPVQTARLAFTKAVRETINAQTQQPALGPLPDVWATLTNSQQNSVSASLMFNAGRIGDATGQCGSLKAMLDLLGDEAPYRARSFTELMDDFDAIRAHAAAEPDTREQRLRADLLTLMSAWSEDQHCAGWLIGLDKELLAEGGVWEILGQAIGWPIGYMGEGGWTTWDEAKDVAHRGEVSDERDKRE